MKKKRIFKFKEWKTIDIALMAATIALYMVVAFITKDLIPVLPLSISFSIEFIAIFFIAWITESFLKTLLVAIVCGLFLLALPGVQANTINPWSFLFDYFLDNVIISISAFFVVKNKDRKNILRWINFVSWPFVFIFIFRMISGLLFWSGPEYRWSNFSPFWYCVIVDGANTLVDYLLMLILVPIIFSRLYVLKDKYNARNKTRKA